MMCIDLVPSGACTLTLDPDVHISPQPGSGQDLDFSKLAELCIDQELCFDQELCIDQEMVRHLLRVAVHT